MSNAKGSNTISAASAYVLRVGVICSAGVMLLGLIVSFVHGRLPIDRMTTAPFDDHPADIARGILAGRGQAIIELGVYLLLATPIMRVFTSMLIFAFSEKDRVYALITLVVLIMTLCGLLFAR